MDGEALFWGRVGDVSCCLDTAALVQRFEWVVGEGYVAELEQI
jgi:hypothetical protein